MRLLRSRSDKRRWSRRLVDDETGELIDSLEETSEMFRTASGEFQLRGLCVDVFANQATTDIRWLRDRGIEGEEFYRRELAPSWDGLDRDARGAKIDQFIELSQMLATEDEDRDPSPEFVDLVATVHVKVLLLAWSYDRTYSYIDRLFNGPLQYRTHRYRIAGGHFSQHGASAPTPQ